MQEADYGMTAQAHQGVSGRHNGDENLLVRFYLHPTKDKRASVTEGRPIFADLPWIQIMQPGNKESIIHRKATDMDKARFADHFRKFEAREDQEVVEGTPLIEWPGITRAQAEELKFFNVLSVEQLAGMSDTNTQNFRGMGALKRSAVAYLEMSKDNAGSEALAIVTQRNEELQATIQEMSDRLAALEGSSFDSEPIPDFDVTPQAKPTRRRKA